MDSRSYTFIHNMIHDVPGISFQDKLNTLNNCFCCERHQINKPSLFIPWQETPITINKIQIILPYQISI